MWKSNFLSKFSKVLKLSQTCFRASKIRLGSTWKFGQKVRHPHLYPRRLIYITKLLGYISESDCAKLFRLYSYDDHVHGPPGAADFLTSSKSDSHINIVEADLLTILKLLLIHGTKVEWYVRAGVNELRNSIIKVVKHRRCRHFRWNKHESAFG